MEIQKHDNRASISIDKQELIEMMLEKANLDKSLYKHFYDNIGTKRIVLRVATALEPSKTEIKKRSKSLEKAASIKFFDFIEEFRSTATPDTKVLTNRFCNEFKGYTWRETTLADMLQWKKGEFMCLRGIGEKGFHLFEQFLQKKGYRFEIDTEKLV